MYEQRLLPEVNRFEIFIPEKCDCRLPERRKYYFKEYLSILQL
jgi:hypothetical protein